jgi:hypothetical protein
VRPCRSALHSPRRCHSTMGRPKAGTRTCSAQPRRQPQTSRPFAPAHS